MKNDMKKISEKENQYPQIRRTVAIMGLILIIAIVISLIYLAIAIKVFSTSYLYLAIGLPIMLCFDTIIIFFLYFFAKKERTIKKAIYNTNKLTTSNPIFQEVIEEYYDNQLESLGHLLPKKCRVIDIDDYNNSINIGIRTQVGLQIEVAILETDIIITWESAKSEEEISVHKSLTSDNFTGLDSVLFYIATTCEKISES